MRTSAEPNKIYINQKVLIRAVQKCNFLLKFSLCVKSYGHLYQVLPWPLTKYGHVTSKPDTALNFRKCHQIWGKLAQEQKS